MSAVETILSRLDGVQSSGKGWRSKCPACGGHGRKVSIVEGDAGKTLVHCFGGCQALTVLQAIGLEVADLFPERLRDDTPEGLRMARRAARQAQWGAALEMLALEARVVHLAGCEIQAGRILSPQNATRVALAVERISDARSVLRDPQQWRPQRDLH